MIAQNLLEGRSPLPSARSTTTRERNVGFSAPSPQDVFILGWKEHLKSIEEDKQDDDPLEGSPPPFALFKSSVKRGDEII